RAGRTDRRGDGRDATLAFLIRHSPSARPRLVERRSKRVDRLDGARAKASRLREALLAHNAHRLLAWQRRKPCLAVRGNGKRHSADHLRLIDQPCAASLHVNDPAQRPVAFQDRHAHELLRFLRQLLQDRPREVGNAGADEHALSHDGESQREAIEAGFRLLLHPSHAAQRSEEPVYGALLQPQPFADCAKAIRAGFLGEELDQLKAPLQQGIDDLHDQEWRFESGSGTTTPLLLVDLTLRSDLEYRYTS